LDDLDGVLESAVIGAPHPDFGESVVAVLVPEPGRTLDRSTIESKVKKNLAGFKRPRRIEIVESLPRNTMGKVQKNILRDAYATSFQSAAS
ncbi:MAG: malonyl-CoA synthase, partial [Silicimonas sp.]|nr:malonyl-CoA synthase [Silicimonas sp.]